MIMNLKLFLALVFIYFFTSRFMYSSFFPSKTFQWLLKINEKNFITFSLSSMNWQTFTEWGNLVPFVAWIWHAWKLKQTEDKERKKISQLVRREL